MPDIQIAYPSGVPAPPPRHRFVNFAAGNRQLWSRKELGLTKSVSSLRQSQKQAERDGCRSGRFGDVGWVQGSGVGVDGRREYARCWHHLPCSWSLIVFLNLMICTGGRRYLTTCGYKSAVSKKWFAPSACGGGTLLV